MRIKLLGLALGVSACAVVRSPGDVMHAAREGPMRIKLLGLALVVSACAVNTGVTQMYGDVLTVSRQGATGASSATALRLEALAEAEAYCTSFRQEFYLVELVENVPPFVLGNFPRAEVRFMCLAPIDPRLLEQRS